MAKKGKTSIEHYDSLQADIKALEVLNIIGSNGVCELVLNKDVYNFNYKEVKVFKNSNKENRKIPLTPEELSRIGILHSLMKDGYKGENLVLETQYQLGRNSKDKPKRLDISLNYADEAFAIVEVKQKSEFDYENDKDIEGQLFNIASIQQTQQTQKIGYLVYCCSYIDKISRECVTEFVVIDYSKYTNFKDWASAGKPHSKSVPLNYDKKSGVQILCGNPLPTMNAQEINALKQKINNKLYAGGGVADNLIFTTIVNAFLCKLHDEDVTESGKPYKFQYVYEEDLEGFKDRLNQLYRESLRDKFGFVIEDANQDKYQITDFSKIKIHQVITLVESLQKYDLNKTISTANYDVLGDFFESISRDQFKQTKGQFFTHQKIVDFILDMSGLESLYDKTVLNNKLPYIADLSAGSGTFLISAMKKVSSILEIKKQNPKSKKIADLINNEWSLPNKPNKWAQTYIYGTEKDIDLGTAIKVNMILHGDGQANIGVGSIYGDGLVPLPYFKQNLNIERQIRKTQGYSKDVLPCLDLIVSNPPFSVDLDSQTKSGINFGFELSDCSDSELLFIERYYQTLNIGGRIGIVIPESVLDGERADVVRKFMIKYFHIKAVVSLPEDTFAPFTTVKTSVLFLEKREVPLDDISLLSNNLDWIKSKEFEIYSSNINEEQKKEELSKLSVLKKAINENIAYFEIKNVGYKRRKNKPELVFQNSDLDQLVKALKEKNVDIWSDLQSNQNINGLHLVNLPLILRERTTRLDYSYNSVFNTDKLEINAQHNISTFIELIDEKLTGKMGIDLLDNIKSGATPSIDYCEINNIDSNGFIASTSKIFQGQDEDEIQEISSKIKKNDVITVLKSDILMSCVRPYLNKNVLIDDSNRNYYYTKAFISLKVKEGLDPLVMYHLIKTILAKKVMAVSRYGKSYPTLKAEDLLSIKLNQVEINEMNRLKSDIVNLRQAYKDVSIQESILKTMKDNLKKF